VQRDVAVIGGGLLGTAAAYYLARAGADVLLLEKDQLNCHASGQNAGSLHFQLEFRMVEHGDDLTEAFARTLPLVLEAQRGWGELERELETDLEVIQAGGLMLVETREQQEVLSRKQAIERRWGLRTELLTGDEARSLAPYLSQSVRAAGWCPDEGHANPRLIAPAFARAALRLGAEIRAGTRAVGLARRSGGWRVSVEPGPEIQAESVLVTAGIWTGQVTALADVRLPVIPVGLSMLATETAAPLIGHLVQHVGYRLSLKQAHDGNVLIGGGWASKLIQRRGVVDLERRPELRLESLAGNASTACRAVPAIRSLAVLRAWSGVAAVTADQLPLLGELRRRPGLFVAACGPGFTLGPTYARLVSQLVLAGRSELAIDAYSPNRFAHLNVV